MSNPYREADSRFPWLSHQEIDGIPFKFLMVCERSQNWYGQPGAVESNKEYTDLIKPGYVTVDAGCNEGFTSILAALRAGPTGKVFAVDPAPHNLQPLHTNIALNNLEKRIEVIPMALSNEEGELAFSGEAAAAGEFVKCSTIDKLFPTGMDVLKIDVEGFEKKLVEGGLKTLREFKPLIFLEAHLDGQSGGKDMREYGDNPEDLYNLLTEIGYEFYRDGHRVDAIASGAMVLRHKDWVEPKQNLFVAMAYGDEAWMQAQIMVSSLRGAGKFTGRVILFTDRPGVILGAETVVDCSPLMLPRIGMAKPILGRSLCLEGVNRVCFTDVDVVFVSPVDAAINSLPGTVSMASECVLDGGNPDYFSIPEFPTVYGEQGYNAGVIVADATVWRQFCTAWLTAETTHRVWETTLGFDQAAVNHIVKKTTEFDFKPMPGGAVHFVRDGYQPLDGNTFAVHVLSTDKLNTMRTLQKLSER